MYFGNLPGRVLLWRLYPHVLSGELWDPYPYVLNDEL
jgi:hypothetical protein